MFSSFVISVALVAMLPVVSVNAQYNSYAGLDNCVRRRASIIEANTKYNGDCGSCDKLIKDDDDSHTLDCWDNCEICSPTSGNCYTYKQHELFFQTKRSNWDFTAKFTSGPNKGEEWSFSTTDFRDCNFWKLSETVYPYPGKPGTCQSCYYDYLVDSNGRIIIDCSNVDGGFVRDEVVSEGILADLFDLDDNSFAGDCKGEASVGSGALTCNQYTNVGIEHGQDDDIKSTTCSECSNVNPYPVCVTWETTRDSLGDKVKAAHGLCSCASSGCGLIKHGVNGDEVTSCQSCSTPNCNPILSGGKKRSLLAAGCIVFAGTIPVILAL